MVVGEYDLAEASVAVSQVLEDMGAFEGCDPIEIFMRMDRIILTVKAGLIASRQLVERDIQQDTCDNLPLPHRRS